MLPKFICWFLGHKFKVKAYTGKTFKSVNGFGQEMVGMYYKWQTLQYCHRCDCANKF